MIRWEKRGRIFVPDGSLPWMRSHAGLPVADLVDEQTLRIYFAGRDDHGRSRIGCIDVDAEEPQTVLHLHTEPLLPLGERGTFDDNGMTPSCIVSDGDCKYLYYIGWNPQVTVSYRLAIGLAISTDGGLSYRRYSLGPLLDRDCEEPFFNTAPCVMREGRRWRMWYVSCIGWEEVQGHPEPRYDVKYAESDDGIAWRRTGLVAVASGPVAEAIGRPWVVRLADRYTMLFSYRGLVDYRTDRSTSYRVGSAESLDGLHWQRGPDPHGLQRSPAGWDSQMLGYTQMLRIRGRLYCFYNGNGFGQSGFGYAVAVEGTEEEAGTATRKSIAIAKEDPCGVP